MAFKSDRHRKWYFANKKNGTLSSKSVGSLRNSPFWSINVNRTKKHFEGPDLPSGSISGKKKFYGNRKSSSHSNSPPHPALSGPSDWYSSMY